MGVGYAIAYKILEEIFNDIPISLKYEDLYDSITRLKEIFDYYKPDVIGTQEKIFSKEDKLATIIIYQHYRGNRRELGRGIAATKPDAEQKAASKSIEFLKKYGYVKPVPELYVKYS